jgi:hypothetical protein
MIEVENNNLYENGCSSFVLQQYFFICDLLELKNILLLKRKRKIGKKYLQD